MKIPNLLLIFALTLAQSVFATDTPRLFVMLDLDNTIVDRLDPFDEEAACELAQEGFTVQRLEFDVNKGNNPHFFTFYKKRLDLDNEWAQDNFMNRVEVSQLPTGGLHVAERVVVRPGAAELIESLLRLDLKVHILVCSNNDDDRNRNLVERLDLTVNGSPFKDSVEWISRSNYRVAPAGGEASWAHSKKSAALLRASYAGKYGSIRPSDYVVLIDQLPDERFTASDPSTDLNVYLVGFEVNSPLGFNRWEDRNFLRKTVIRISDFLEN